MLKLSIRVFGSHIYIYPSATFVNHQLLLSVSPVYNFVTRSIGVSHIIGYPDSFGDWLGIGR